MESAGVVLIHPEVRLELRFQAANLHIFGLVGLFTVIYFRLKLREFLRFPSTETSREISFYFPHMKYGKYWFHLHNFFVLQIFTFQNFLYLKNSLERKKFPSVMRRCRPSFGRNLYV
jgi:hypothetical protein